MFYLPDKKVKEVATFLSENIKIVLLLSHPVVVLQCTFGKISQFSMCGKREGARMQDAGTSFEEKLRDFFAR